MPAGWVAAGVAAYSAYDSHQQAKANREAIQGAQTQNQDLSGQRYQQAQDLLNPYIKSAETARNQLDVEMGLAPGTPGTAYMQTPGYKTAMQGVQQSGANAGTLYSGRRIADAGGVQSQFYNNYMSLLQNMANPASATNLANIGIGQAGTLGQQNLQTTQLANQYATQGTEATNAAIADLAKGGANLYNQYQNQQQSSTPSIPSTVYYGSGYVPPGGSFGTSAAGTGADTSITGYGEPSYI